MPLSLEKSPNPWCDNSLALLLEPARKKDGWSAPASADDLRDLQSELRKAVSHQYGSIGHLMDHAIPRHLARIDHLIAVHICGYEFREESGRSAPDWGYTFCGWKTGTGTYTGDATRKWTTDSDEAMALVRRYSPHLRLDVRIGGARHGQVRKARFGRKHPTLAGQAIPLPAEWPPAVKRFPAVAIVDTFLTAFAIEKDAASASSACAVAEN